MTIDTWVREIETLLHEAAQTDFGYSIGSNVLVPPGKLSMADKQLDELGLQPIEQIREFYKRCDGIRWPGIRNGYFVFRIAELVHSDPESVPQTITGPYADKIVVIGSSGGGDVFAIARTSMAILHLPPGPMHLGVYDDQAGGVKLIANDFSSFLESLHADLRAFVRKIPGHRYLI